MPDSSKRGALLCKTEVTYGTDSVPVAATNAVAVMNPQFTTDATLVERDQILRDSIQSVVGCHRAQAGAAHLRIGNERQRHRRDSAQIWADFKILRTQ